jgi:hypothetical protein
VREVAFSIIDMNDKGWPQLLDVDRQIQLLLPNLVENLGMPRQLNYVLIPKGANLPLDGRHTLAEYRIPGGAELYLRPLRDHLLKMFLDKLYDEVKDQLKEQLIDSAKEKLKQILHLDPTYPDPLRLKERLLGAVPQAPLSNAFQQQPQYQYQKQPKAGPGKGCLIAGIVGGGAALILAGVVVLSILILPALLKTSSGTPTGTSTEPVLGTGDVQVTLRWDAPVDLDLHVTDPSGEEISFTHPNSNSGGNLDVDANPNCDSMVSNPVENVFWPYGSAPTGQYQVSVAYFSNCNYSGPVNYEVTIKQNNQVVNVLTGTVNESGETKFVTSFSR